MLTKTWTPIHSFLVIHTSQVSLTKEADKPLMKAHSVTIALLLQLFLCVKLFVLQSHLKWKLWWHGRCIAAYLLRQNIQKEAPFLPYMYLYLPFSSHRYESHIKVASSAASLETWHWSIKLDYINKKWHIHVLLMMWVPFSSPFTVASPFFGAMDWFPDVEAAMAQAACCWANLSRKACCRVCTTSGITASMSDSDSIGRPSKTVPSCQGDNRWQHIMRGCDF